MTLGGSRQGFHERAWWRGLDDFHPARKETERKAKGTIPKGMRPQVSNNLKPIFVGQVTIISSKESRHGSAVPTLLRFGLHKVSIAGVWGNKLRTAASRHIKSAPACLEHKGPGLISNTT